MGQKLLLRLAVLGLAEVFLSQGLAQTTPSDSVTLYVTVEDKGKTVSGLSARNFRVWEDGEPQIVQQAEPSKPASIVLLIENSLTSWHFLNDVRSAMRGFLKSAPEGHSYALVTYARNANVEVGLTRQIDKIAAAYQDVRQSAWRDTDTHDAVYRVLEEMGGLAGRRVLIVIGFGYDSFSRRTFGELQRVLESTNVQVYGIATGSSLRNEQTPQLETTGLDARRGEMLFQMLARTSGALSYCPSCEADYSDSMRDIMESLDKQYTLRYERAIAPEASFRKIKVEAFRLNDDVRHDFKMRVRPGWRF